jgi:AraC family transcriptional regulator of adaptative response/methylated-DNA-[protein]-cysteine methyltransferase
LFDDTAAMTDNPPDHHGHHYDIVARAIGYIRNHATRQPSLSEIANAVALSEFHFQRIFAEWAGISPKRFLQYLTKEHAKRALRESADVLTATFETGLSSPSRLHDLMVSCEAMTPGEIRGLGRGMNIGYGVSPTPFGMAMLGWTDRGICHFEFIENAPELLPTSLQLQWPNATFSANHDHAKHIVEKIFPQERKFEKIHLVLKGTNFQIKVWNALLTAGSAQVISYSDVAKHIGSPNARRAVGSAVAANTIAYLIPCHRVIRETGETGNYRWDSARKAAILAWEAAREHRASPLA